MANNPDMEPVSDIVQGSDESSGIGSNLAVAAFAILVVVILYWLFPWQLLVGIALIAALFIVTGIINGKLNSKADDSYILGADPALFNRVAVIDSVASLARMLGLAFGILFLLAYLTDAEKSFSVVPAIICFAVYVISFVQVALRAPAKALVPKNAE